jgi:hypothetical protein
MENEFILGGWDFFSITPKLLELVFVCVCVTLHKGKGLWVWKRGGEKEGGAFACAFLFFFWVSS